MRRTKFVRRTGELSSGPVMRVLVVWLLLASTAVAAPDWGVRRDPFDRMVVARYREILAGDPHDAVLVRLVALYRSYRTLDELRASFDTDDWASLVVRARLERGRDDARARELMLRAATMRDDLRTWIAVGELERAQHPTDARAAYRKALGLTRDRASEVSVRVALAELAIAVGDATDASEQLRVVATLDPAPARWLAYGDVATPREALVAYREAEARTREPLNQIDAITRQAAAHGTLGEHREAIAALHRALAISPRGSGLASDLVLRIVEHARLGKRTTEQLAVFEALWPSHRRGAFEHVVLGDLHVPSEPTADIANGDPRCSRSTTQTSRSAGCSTGSRTTANPRSSNGGDRQAYESAITEYRLAIAASPRDPLAYHRLVALFDRTTRPADAIAVLASLAQQLPRDTTIQLELARRHGASREADLILDALAASREAGVHSAIADLYVTWKRPAQAAIAYERAARIDPRYRSNLAMAYAAAGDRAALEHLARVTRDADHLQALATIMLEHAMWSEAHAAFTSAIARANRPEAWSGRAGANEGLERWNAAADDAARALALTRTADDTTLTRMRHVVVRDLLRTDNVERYWRAWRTQLVRDPRHRDLVPLMEELQQSDRITLEFRLETLRGLREQFPDDRRLISDYFETFAALHASSRSLDLVRWLATQPGQGVEQLAAHEHQLREIAAYHAHEESWQVAGLREGKLVDVVSRTPTDAAILRTRLGATASLGIADARRFARFGARAILPLAGPSLAVRADWTTGAGLGGSAGLLGRIAQTSGSLWSVGGGVRVAHHGPISVGGELGIEMTRRFSPVGLGLRFGRDLGGPTTANLELVVEWR